MLGYVSDDDIIIKRSGHNYYSRDDFRDSYCHTERSIATLENRRSQSTNFLFGCLSSYQDSPCKRSHHEDRRGGGGNFFTSCYGQHPRDQSYYESKSSKKKNKGTNWDTTATEMHSLDYYDQSGAGSRADSRASGGRGGGSDSEGGFNESRREMKNRYYIWNQKMEKYIASTSVQQQQNLPQQHTRMPVSRYSSAPPLNTILGRSKHVSFDTTILNRSNTSSSFEENKLRKATMLNMNLPQSMAHPSWQNIPCSSIQGSIMTRSQERLLDTSRGFVNIEKPKKCVKSASTQTDNYIVRASGPPPYLSLSPRTSYRVRMVSQGAQTNGGLLLPPPTQQLLQQQQLQQQQQQLQQPQQVTKVNGDQIKIMSKSQSAIGDGFSDSNSSCDELNKLNNKLNLKRAKLIKTYSDGEILIERKRASHTAYLDVDIYKGKKNFYGQEESVLKYKVDEDEVPPPPPPLVITRQKSEDSKLIINEDIIIRKDKIIKTGEIVQTPEEDIDENKEILFDEDYYDEETFHEELLRSIQKPLYIEKKQISLFGVGGNSIDSTAGENSSSSSSSGSYSLFNSSLENKKKKKKLKSQQSVELKIPFPIKLPEPIEEPLSNTIIPEDVLIVVKPPDDFADSSNHNSNHKIPTPEIQPTTTSSIIIRKKLKRRKSSTTHRAKSEERHVCSTMHRIDATTQSSVSLHSSLCDLNHEGNIITDFNQLSEFNEICDEDKGMYLEPYNTSQWLYITEAEESRVWRKHEPHPSSTDSDETANEKEFRKRYKATTHRMVHRKATRETYKRLDSNTLEIDKRCNLEREKSTGEYGFRIHGSRPVVISAVEKLTSADISGLEVGDVLITINGINVLDSSHSDVIRIASRSNTLELELTSTNASAESSQAVISNIVEQEEQMNTMVGYLWKMRRTEEQKGLPRKRYVVLNGNRRLIYWYKDEKRESPLGVLQLYQGKLEIKKQISLDGLFTFNIITESSVSGSSKEKRIVREYEFGHEYEVEIDNWITAIQECVKESGTTKLDTSPIKYYWFQSITNEYMTYESSRIPNEDSSGYLWKLNRRLKQWKQIFCLVKDACLYFYLNSNSPNAFGCTHLHGYRVQTLNNFVTGNVVIGPGSTSTKRYTFELIPPKLQMKHYFLSTETENDRKRWLAAFEYSIDRWLSINP